MANNFLNTKQQLALRSSPSALSRSAMLSPRLQLVAALIVALPKRESPRCRRVLFAHLMLPLALASACGGGADDDRPPALPPGMMPAPTTNANRMPPEIPFFATTTRTVPRVIRQIPHDTTAFTQGLLVANGRMFEGTGQTGRSELRELDLSNGSVLRRIALPPQYFGEGIAVVGTKLYQLTWTHGRGFTYDIERFVLVDSFTYEGEGWGLTTDGQRMFLSDGTSNIRVVDTTFQIERTIQVQEQGRPVWFINELEWVRGELWANIFYTDLIARIDPSSGNVIGYIDIGALLTTAERAAARSSDGVANGIAFDARRNRIYVTGKHWPHLFEIAVDSTR